jgi:hypothetical protein
MSLQKLRFAMLRFAYAYALPFAFALPLPMICWFSAFAVATLLS